MNCLAGYSPERILPVLYQFSLVDYALPSCQMVHLLLGSFLSSLETLLGYAPYVTPSAHTHTRA